MRKESAEGDGCMWAFGYTAVMKGSGGVDYTQSMTKHRLHNLKREEARAAL